MPYQSTVHLLLTHVLLSLSGISFHSPLAKPLHWLSYPANILFPIVSKSTFLELLTYRFQLSGPSCVLHSYNTTSNTSTFTILFFNDLLSPFVRCSFSLIECIFCKRNLSFYITTASSI